MGARLLTAGYSTIYLIEFLEETYGDRALDHIWKLFPPTCTCYDYEDDDDYNNQFTYGTDRNCNYCWETAESGSHISIENLLPHSADDEISEGDADFDDVDDEDLCNMSDYGDFNSTHSYYDLDNDVDLDSINMQDPDNNWDYDLDLQVSDGVELETDSEEFEENSFQPRVDEDRADFRVLENIQRSEHGYRQGRHTRRRKGTWKHHNYQNQRKKSLQTTADDFSVASLDIHEDIEDQMTSPEEIYDKECFSTHNPQLKANITHCLTSFWRWARRFIHDCSSK